MSQMTKHEVIKYLIRAEFPGTNPNRLIAMRREGVIPPASKAQLEEIEARRGELEQKTPDELANLVERQRKSAAASATAKVEHDGQELIFNQPWAKWHPARITLVGTS